MAKEDKRIVITIDNVSGFESASIISSLADLLGKESPDAKYTIEYGEAAKSAHTKTKEVK